MNIQTRTTSAVGSVSEALAALEQIRQMGADSSFAEIGSLTRRLDRRSLQVLVSLLAEEAFHDRTGYEPWDGESVAAISAGLPGLGRRR